MFNKKTIKNTKEAKDSYGWGHGASDVVLSKRDLKALLAGKCIAWDDGEYVTYLSLVNSDGDISRL